MKRYLFAIIIILGLSYVGVVFGEENITISNKKIIKLRKAEYHCPMCNVIWYSWSGEKPDYVPGYGVGHGCKYLNMGYSHDYIVEIYSKFSKYFVYICVEQGDVRRKQ